MTAKTELSRRAAWAFQSSVITSLAPEARRALAERVEAAGSWSALDPGDRDIILAAEAELAGR